MTGQTHVPDIDLMIIGAGPVGLMCAYLAKLCGLKAVIIDKSLVPLEVGRADALNARTLQLLELVDLFRELYPQGKPCNTSSIWSKGRFISRQSSWWEELQGCMHPHFLMLGQSFIEKALDRRLKDLGARVRRNTSVREITLTENTCVTTLSSGEVVTSRFVIGADGARSFVREQFNIAFEVTRPELIWAVIDGIIVFQAETSDVAWIPREGAIDRFYVRMDKKDFELDEVISKINLAMTPHTLKFKEIVWFSQFSVKESVAEKFQIEDRVFLVGDACHIHSVNGGQGLNTGLADAFNLIWKLNVVKNFGAESKLLKTYETERKAVALSVVQTSGELVRATKYSDLGTHAEDYLKIVQKRAGNITGMGIRYGKEGVNGTRIHDFEIFNGARKTRLYTLLDYTQFTLLVFNETKPDVSLPDFVRLVHLSTEHTSLGFWTKDAPYRHQALLIRPDSYVHLSLSLEEMDSFDFDQNLELNQV